MAKGPSWERKACKQLSLWWSNGENDHVFWRTAGSGGRATVRAKRGLTTADHCGDVCAIDISGKPLTDRAVIELKSGYTKGSPSKRASLLAFLDNLPSEKEPVILRWIKKVEEERRFHHRNYWFIIFKRDRKQPVICMMKQTFEHLNNHNPNRYSFPPFGTTCDFQLKDKTLRFMRLSDFLTWCTPEVIIRRIRRRKKQLNWKEFNKIQRAGGNVSTSSSKFKRKIKRR